MDASQPKVTQGDVDASIERVDYVVLPDGRTTIALVYLDNGFTVRGESACVVAAEFDQTTGEHYALEDAKKQVWRFLGFRLAELKHAAAVLDRNLQSHDFQLFSNSQGIKMCSRCGCSEISGKKYDCDAFIAKLAARG